MNRKGTKFDVLCGPIAKDVYRWCWPLPHIGSPLKHGHMSPFDHNRAPGESLNQVHQDAQKPKGSKFRGTNSAYIVIHLISIRLNQSNESKSD